MRDERAPVTGGKVVRLAALFRSAIKSREQRTAPAVEAFEGATTREQTTTAASELLTAVAEADIEYGRDLDTAVAHVGDLEAGQ